MHDHGGDADRPTRRRRCTIMARTQIHDHSGGADRSQQMRRCTNFSGHAGLDADADQVANACQCPTLGPVTEARRLSTLILWFQSRSVSPRPHSVTEIRYHIWPGDHVRTFYVLHRSGGWRWVRRQAVLVYIYARISQIAEIHASSYKTHSSQLGLIPISALALCSPIVAS